MDEDAARAELGVAPEAPLDDVRAAFETRARVLDAAGKRLALDRVVEAYRVLAPDIASGARAPRRPPSLGAVLAVLACLFVVGVAGGIAIAHGPHATPARPPAPSTDEHSAVPATAGLDPQQLVLTAGDLGPGFEPVRSGPAKLGAGGSDARGWDAVYRSPDGRTLVESIAVVYSTPPAATTAAGQLSPSPDPGTDRAIATNGRVLVIVVVAPAGGDSAALLERARQAAVSRASAGGG